MTYRIRKGRYYSTHWLGLLWRFVSGWLTVPRVRASFTFSKECLTPAPEPEDINKLFGISSGQHHTDSARIGWRANGAKIDLYSYVYKDGIRMRPKLLASVFPGIAYSAQVEKGGRGYYLITVYSRTGLVLAQHREVVGSFPEKAVYHKLYPYFGGSHPAPCEMEIDLKWR